MKENRGESERVQEGGRDATERERERRSRNDDAGVAERGQKNWRVRFAVAPINFECTYIAVGGISSLLVMIKKNYKQKIPRMASLFRGSARQAE